jgi:Rho guanine nucleotide exchange factor 4/29
VSASVLQKFKKTFSHLKSQKVVTSVTELPPPAADNNKHRFGNLVWRTSKERRKTKSHRRDKCNSGDSGIQVELDNEEHNNDELVNLKF